MSRVVAKVVDTHRKGVSTEEVNALVNPPDGTRVNIDLDAGLTEIVEITGFSSAASTAESCRQVRECTTHEEDILLRALGANIIRRHACETPCGTIFIAVMH